MYFSITYKNIKEKWVMCEFYEPNVSMIVDRILKSTKNTYVYTYGNLYCKSADDFEKINKILKEESFKIIKQKQIEYEKLPNLLIESIKQLLKPNEND